MSLDFGKAPGGGDTYPKRSFDGQEDQSYGFNPAFKLQTGNLRGTQKVGYGSVEIDGAHERIKLDSDNTQIVLGDVSDDNDVTGIGLSDSDTGKTLVTLGRDSSGASTGLTVYDSAGTKRLLGGSYPDGSIKIKLSQSGYDVTTATDDQLIWSSDFNMFKIAATGIATVPAIAAAADSSNLTVNSVIVSTGVTATSPLAFTVYAKNGSSTYGVIPLTITYGDAAQGARISATWFASSFVQNGELKLNIAGNNFVNSIQDARDFRWYVYKETAATT